MSRVACPLCGNRFDRDAEAAGCHGVCPMNDGCNLVKCPGCGYEWPGDSRLVTWLKKLFRVAESDGRTGSPVATGKSTGDEIVQIGVRRS